jgi:hypothetical protein
VTHNQIFKNLSRTIFLFFLLLPAGLQAQNAGSISFGVSPSFTLPLGESASLYSPGGGGDMYVDFPVPGLSSLNIRAGLGYSYLPVQADIALSEMSVKAGLGYELELVPFFTLFADAGGGYFIGVLPFKTGNNSFGTGLLVEGGGGVQFNFSPGLSVRLGAAYKYDVDLYSGVKVYLTAGLRQGKGAPGKANLEIQNIDIQRIFPVFYKYYDAHSLGNITIKNLEPGTI